MIDPPDDISQYHVSINHYTPLAVKNTAKKHCTMAVYVGGPMPEAGQQVPGLPQGVALTVINVSISVRYV